MTKKRLYYGVAFLLLFLVEVFIALFVRDAVIRPYGGDLLVTVLLCCFGRIFFPAKYKLLPLWVFLFALAVELAQGIHIVDLLGLQENRLLSTLLGNTFSFADILCYLLGCLLFWAVERKVDPIE